VIAPARSDPAADKFNQNVFSRPIAQSDAGATKLAK